MPHQSDCQAEDDWSGAGWPPMQGLQPQPHVRPPHNPIVLRGTFLNAEAKIPENRTITRVVIGIAGCAKAKHAFTLLIFESFLSSTKMVDETLARHGPVCVLRIRDNGVCRGSATWCQFAILTNQTLPGVPCHN